MAMEFGKLNFAVGFNRTSAFPLDANSYFEKYNDAVAAAAGAAAFGAAAGAAFGAAATGLAAGAPAPPSSTVTS